MITEEDYGIGVSYSEPSLHINDRHVKGPIYLNYDDNTLGLLPIRRIK